MVRKNNKKWYIQPICIFVSLILIGGNTAIYSFLIYAWLSDISLTPLFWFAMIAFINLILSVTIYIKSLDKKTYLEVW